MIKTDTKLKKILVVDGSYLIHRALHQRDLFELRAPNGKRSGGVFQVLRSLNAEMRKNSDYFPIVCWDSKLSKRRVEADPCYKHANERNTNYEILTEEEADNDYLTQYRTQRSMVMQLLAYCGIPSLRFDSWEGDDLMYILSKISEEARVLTDDRDMLQLLSETTTVRRPMANELWTLDSFLKERNFDRISDFVIWKAVMGDGSDNIPGCCKGVGEKSINDFIKLLLNFHYSEPSNHFDFSGYPETVDTMKNYCELIGIKYKKAYLNFNPERFFINLKLVDLRLVDKDVTPELMDSIFSILRDCNRQVNYFSLVKGLGELGIKEISADELLSNVSQRKSNLFGANLS